MKNASSNPAKAQERSRPYRSTLRQKQAEATRELILRALAEQLAADGVQDFSITEAAERAGVAVRTIYRYFPNREALLDGMGDWVEQQLGDLPYPDRPDEVADLAEQVFPRFEEQATLIRALLLSEVGQSVRSRRRLKRRQAVDTSLQSVTNQYPTPAEAEAIRAVIGHLVTAETWKHLHDEFGIDGHAAGKAVSWAVRTLIHQLQHEAQPAEIPAD